jgi:hypothetical protein
MAGEVFIAYDQVETETETEPENEDDDSGGASPGGY